MFCSKCGKEIADGSTVCEFCGEKIKAKAPANPLIEALKEGIKCYFTKIVDFKTSVKGNEYWGGVLAYQMVNIICTLLTCTIILSPFALIISWANKLPEFSLAARRLNKMGKNWAFAFLTLIPMADIVFLIYWGLVDDAAVVEE